MTGGAPVRDVARFAGIVRDDIVPLLEEYCYEDFEALERILGPTLIQKAKQRVDVGFFEPARHMDLIQALLSAFEGITATKQAVEADVPAADTADEDDEDEVEAPQGPAA